MTPEFLKQLVELTISKSFRYPNLVQILTCTVTNNDYCGHATLLFEIEENLEEIELLCLHLEETTKAVCGKAIALKVFHSPRHFHAKRTVFFDEKEKDLEKFERTLRAAIALNIEDSVRHATHSNSDIQRVATNTRKTVAELIRKGMV